MAGMEEGEEDDEEALMAKMMGFSGFSTTHNKKVSGNNVGAIAKKKANEYRQYMWVYLYADLIIGLC